MKGFSFTRIYRAISIGAATCISPHICCHAVTSFERCNDVDNNIQIFKIKEKAILATLNRWHSMKWH